MLDLRSARRCFALLRGHRGCAEVGIAHITRRHAVAAPERAVEMGKIAKAALESNVGDLTAPPLRIPQQGRRFFQALFLDVVTEASAGLLEQEVHIARRN